MPFSCTIYMLSDKQQQRKNEKNKGYVLEFVSIGVVVVFVRCVITFGFCFFTIFVMRRLNFRCSCCCY